MHFNPHFLLLTLLSTKIDAVCAGAEPVISPYDALRDLLFVYPRSNAFNQQQPSRQSAGSLVQQQRRRPGGTCIAQSLWENNYYSLRVQHDLSGSYPQHK